MYTHPYKKVNHLTLHCTCKTCPSHRNAVCDNLTESKTLELKVTTCFDCKRERAKVRYAKLNKGKKYPKHLFRGGETCVRCKAPRKYDRYKKKGA